MAFIMNNIYDLYRILNLYICYIVLKLKLIKKRYINLTVMDLLITLAQKIASKYVNSHFLILKMLGTILDLAINVALLHFKTLTR